MSEPDTTADTTARKRSREYTITVGDGTHDVIAKMAARVAKSFTEAERDATTYEDATRRLKDAGEQAVNLLSQLTSLIYPAHGEGNLRLYPDSVESLWFRWDSGYTGACILHNADGPHPRWSTHT